MNAVVDITNVYLETERLILRPFKEDDLQDFYEYASVVGVGEMAGWPTHENIETSKMILDIFIKGKVTFALELKDNHKVIGSLGIEELRPLDETYDALAGRDIGYVLSKDYWGKGLMVEAVKEVISYCFNKLDYDFLTCYHFNTNLQSKRVIEKVGFTFLKEAEFPTILDTTIKGKQYILLNPNRVK